MQWQLGFLVLFVLLYACCLIPLSVCRVYVFVFIFSFTFSFPFFELFEFLFLVLFLFCIFCSPLFFSCNFALFHLHFCCWSYTILLRAKFACDLSQHCCMHTYPHLYIASKLRKPCVPVEFKAYARTNKPYIYTLKYTHTRTYTHWVTQTQLYIYIHRYAYVLCKFTLHIYFGESAHICSKRSNHSLTGNSHNARMNIYIYIRTL